MVRLYQTVLYATGRYADTGGLALENAGVVVGKNGKIPVIDSAPAAPSSPRSQVLQRSGGGPP